MASEERPVTVTSENGALRVQGGKIAATGAFAASAWTAQPLDDRRILLTLNDELSTTVNQRPGVVGEAQLIVPTVFMSNEPRIAKDFFLALRGSRWSGTAVVDTEFGIKKIYFLNGEIVFAASNIIDDRLGEVIYREAKITLDELTDSAAQVTKTRKFGQVLLLSGVFSNGDLWAALQLQVKQIIRSVFMVERLYMELYAGSELPPTEVHFEEGTANLLNDSFSFGNIYRDFLSRLRTDSEVIMLRPKEQMQQLYKPGTFTGDLISLIAEQSNLQQLLDTSKLIDSYTIAAFIGLVNKGLCTITPAIETEKKSRVALAPLKAKVDAYGYVLQGVRKAFDDANVPFPLADIASFAASLNPEGFASIFVDHTGAISRDCLNSMFSQCQVSDERQQEFMGRMESLTKFLLQVAGDNLDFAVSRALRQDYRSITT